jgi:uncharacterized protein with NAD-binding domain and iron-sulfur cluster
MAEQNKKKVVILGGGIAGLASAYFLTSQSDWQDRYESVTVHQIGWRLGGKCASSRNPKANNRIEEHGIHLFGGFYYNAFAMMKSVYESLDRVPGADPLATIDEAFHPNNASTMWEYLHRGWHQWPSVQPATDRKPWDEDLHLTPKQMLLGALANLAGMILESLEKGDKSHHKSFLEKLGITSPLHHQLERELKHLEEKLQSVENPDHLLPVLETLKSVESWLEDHFHHWLDRDSHVRRAFLMLDYMLTIFTGFIVDDVWQKGFDALDDEDYKAWLIRHGANEATLNSPLPVMHPNILFAYLHGDASNPPTMGAGCFLHWSFLSFSEPGSYAWLFAAGTGETLIAPLYEALSKRGVKFEFFNKVEALRLDSDRQNIDRIEIGVQASIKDGGSYAPLIKDPDTGLIGWPAHPLYDQLSEGDALRAHDEAGHPNLESYWTDWQCPDQKTLQRGEDFDEVVMALSIGALPDTCAELIEHNADWKKMVDNVPAIQTQAFQIWLKEPMSALAADVPDEGHDVFIGANYLAPASAFSDMTHLGQWEGWPADNQPGSILYFCGAMPENPAPPPPYSDHHYPAEQDARVKWQAAQLLQGAASPMMPNAAVQKRNPACGDPVGFDFSLLSVIDTEQHLDNPFNAINAQFFRANIDPTERYVISPPGSTNYRLPPGNSGFENLKLAGDWTRNGLNVGCVEATVMSAELAAAAIHGRTPRLRGHGFYRVPGHEIDFQQR